MIKIDPQNPFDKDTINQIFRLKDGKDYLITRESTNIEFKKSFHENRLEKYFKTMCAFANHSGGFIVFGVENKPHIITGLTNSDFESFDEALMTGPLNDSFSPAIHWEKNKIDFLSKEFGLLYVRESDTKPVIAIKNGGYAKYKFNNGEIFFRYNARSEKIKYAELNKIIENRIIIERETWQNLMLKIGRIGPENAAVMDTVGGVIEGKYSSILIDEDLIQKLKFIQEGKFVEKDGEPTLKLIGNIESINVIAEKEKIVHDDPYIFRPGQVSEKVQPYINNIFRTQPEHLQCWRYFKVRESKDNFNSKYCDYKPAYNTFTYSQEWIDFLIQELSNDEKYNEIMNYNKKRN